LTTCKSNITGEQTDEDQKADQETHNCIGVNAASDQGIRMWPYILSVLKLASLGLWLLPMVKGAAL